ncbi:molybdopterin molybdenumtransferase MoeA [Salibacterium salarium]|uniref:Molybdopterin molybdenumtransferase n=1 Tax=Salibacterium salarium TaxID=284579 RepID=A0A3R9QMJ6_9BACI|nr:gephyrin-like molybdotransferase Glp [Salibacterium salarium]RSL33624.1 molybdopterin molybdenumtransferase MoeA [Salibacterium salarium]
MVEKRTPLPVADAVHKVMKHQTSIDTEWIPIEEASERFLAEDIVADHDVPPFNKSPYDGFAIIADNTTNASREHPITLEVIGEIGAGSVFENNVGNGQAVRIMTGAKIPEDCDAVVMLELVQEHTDNGKNFIEIKRPFKQHDNISFQGEDTEKGTSLVSKGTYIHPGVTALLATFGYAQVPVAKKPVVGVIATGSELLDIKEPLQPGKIRNSNAYMILAQVQKAGGEAKYFGTLSDDFDTCLQAVKDALSEVDILLTTGGVSVGDYDYIPAILKNLKADVLFNKVAMRPGSVTTVASLEDQMIYGLSGNPSACYVGFELFVRPIIQNALHSSTPHLRKSKARLGVDFPKPNPFMRFVRAKLVDEGGSAAVFPAGLDKSGSVTSLSDANALIVLPGGTRGYQQDMIVDVLLLNEGEGSEWPWENIVPYYK